MLYSKKWAEHFLNKIKPTHDEKKELRNSLQMCLAFWVHRAFKGEYIVDVVY